MDLNIADQEPFAKAQNELLGKWNAAPMVAFGTMKRLSAWKMYCRAEKVEFDTANEISSFLKKYETDYKYADDEEKNDLDVHDYVPEEYWDVVDKSEKYLGIIDNISPHPCAFLLCQKDIRREIGIYCIHSKTGSKKTVYAAYIDGATAERFGYLKNDLLKVDVVKVNANAYKRIGIEQPSVSELGKLVKNDTATWDLYAKGYTMGLNQVEREKSKEKVMRYKPRNISELSAFVAGIRPAFQSMVNKLLDREHFDYGVPALDRLLQTPEMPNSFILYQEQMMMILQYAGFSAPESYSSIKAIAKKHPEKVLPLKERFLKGFSGRLMTDEHVNESLAKSTADKVWQIVSDSCQYLFNISHSVSVAFDSLYSAYAKAHYPMDFYAALLTNYAEKKDKDRSAKAKSEMKKAFGITIVPCEFGQDNRDYYLDRKNRKISNALASIKSISQKTAETLYQMKDEFYPTFVDFLYDSEYKSALDKGKIEALIKVGYFHCFGGRKKLLTVLKEFKEGESKFSKIHIQKTQEARLDALRNFEENLPDEDYDVTEIMRMEQEYYGCPMSVFPDYHKYFTVIEVDDKYSPKLKLYNVSTGTMGVMKVKKALYKLHPVKEGDTIFMEGWARKPAYMYKDGERTILKNKTDLWINSYYPVSEKESEEAKAASESL